MIPVIIVIAILITMLIIKSRIEKLEMALANSNPRHA
jgi:hypothetical protein